MDCTLPIHVFFVHTDSSSQMHDLSMADIPSKTDR